MQHCKQDGKKIIAQQDFATAFQRLSQKDQV